MQNDISQLFGKIHVKVKFCIKIDKNSRIVSLNSKVPLKSTIEELMQNSVNKFNEIFEKNSSGFLISSDYSKYTVVPSRKNGEPKTDLPGINIILKYISIGFAPEATLSDCKTSQFCLLYKIESDSLDNCVIQRETKKKIKCMSCNIL